MAFKTKIYSLSQAENFAQAGREGWELRRQLAVRNTDRGTQSYCGIFDISYVCRESMNLVLTSSIFCMKGTTNFVRQGLL